MVLLEKKMPDYEKAKSAAQEVIEKNFVLEPPVNVRELVGRYGFEVIEMDFHNFNNKVAGLADPKTNKIYINKNDPDNRKKFTVAHELGHFLLHRDAMEKYPEKYAVLLRVPIGGETDALEQEANCFAANLLVPKSMLESHKEKSAKEIALIFEVSEDVAGFRKKFEYGS